jgi:hypothetical protein
MHLWTSPVGTKGSAGDWVRRYFIAYLALEEINADGTSADGTQMRSGFA